MNWIAFKYVTENKLNALQGKEEKIKAERKRQIGL